MRKIPDGVFKPRLTSGEKKSDVTTTVATQITESEKAAREAKTARLRLSRLAYEETRPSPDPKKKAGSGKRRSGT
ncbi:hypothetical protein [Aquamicrobium soli]|jgi:hypothetical protein|uniref:Uncharacterized protein n=1 Tax=Aquamicrobium soli TaxID=1811518 RepID=A0ABV7K975_9HYPH